MNANQAEVGAGTESELALAVGHKAAELWQLELDARTRGARVPRFVTLDQRCLGVPDEPMPLDHGTCPTIDHVPEPAAVYGERAARQAAAAVDLATMPWQVVRTSMLWPATAGPRMAGVDATGFAVRTTDLRPVLAGVATRLYKAYTTLCLSHRGADATAVRPAGTILMEVIDHVAQGTAYVIGGAPIVEIATAEGRPVRATTARGLERAGVAPRARALEMFDTCGRLAEGRAGVVELEFLVGSDSTLWIVQRRELRSADAGTGAAALFQGVGEFEGPVLDWRRRSCSSVTLGLIDDISHCASHAVVVPLASTRSLDGFGVAWTTRARRLAAPGALVLVHEPRAQVGMGIHLQASLSEWLPGTLVVRVPADRLPDLEGATSLSVRADGVEAWLTTRTKDARW